MNFFAKLSEIKFGLEFETCISIISDQSEDKSLDEIYRELEARFNKMGERMWLISDRYILEDDMEPDYSLWNITSDGSIRCAEKAKYMIKDNRELKERDETLIFNSVEIVSPIFKLTIDELKKLKVIWDHYIMTDDLVYSVNDSQGLHIHLSHPNLDKKEFLKLWFVFEDIFFFFFPDRKNKFYCKSIREFYFIKAGTLNMEPLDYIETRGIEKFEEQGRHNEKYFSLNTIIDDPHHIEIRLHPGTMVFTEIYNWIKLSGLFLNYSVTHKNIDYDKLEKKSFREKLLFFFSDIINDYSTMQYYLGVKLPQILQVNYRREFDSSLNLFNAFIYSVRTENYFPISLTTTEKDKALAGIL